jgi:hypothetical protein
MFERLTDQVRGHERQSQLIIVLVVSTPQRVILWL